jgi:hypothetical protein
MSKPPSWNRRGSAVTPNGFFTVLKSTGWFPTFRLPNDFRYVTGKSAINPAFPANVVGRFTVPRAGTESVPRETTIALRQIDSDRIGLNSVLRIAAMALIAMAITFAGLLWIMHSPGIHRP